jgi:DNA-nicking Smr family endonuclease
MTTAELQRAGATQEEVVAWRREQLTRAGCRRFEAEVLAREARVDLHEAVALLERGCPSRIALEILI